MGTVYRAVDSDQGTVVALKLLTSRDPRGEDRFAHEAQVLATLDHPGVVRYIAHGADAAGQRWLAMEWLDGEDLATRIQRAALSVDESVAIALAAAQALAAAHVRGVVHRDIKPSNIFLVGGDTHHIKLLDFGIARLSGSTRIFTQSGAVIGTPGYMAPEQARGETAEPRADVFSLGAVLFECLTGRPAFAGAHAVAVLARLLLEDAPRVSESRQGVPTALDAIIARMLAKEPAARPANATETATLLRQFSSEVTPPPGNAALAGGEQRVLSIVIAAPGEGAVSSSDDTVPASHDAESGTAIQAALHPLGARMDRLANGAVIVTLENAGSATEQAMLAARCAFLLGPLFSSDSGSARVRIAVVTGRAVLTGRLPVGELLDRAAAMLLAPPPQLGVAYVDETTQALLDTRFEMMRGVAGRELYGERELGERVRTLLGRPSPCVGRDREVRAIADLFEECFEEKLARAVLVTGPPGIGKSRLRGETVQRIRERRPDAEIWTGRGDLVGDGAPFALLGSTLRNAARIATNASLPARQASLLERLSQRLAGPEQQHVVEFLCEIAGAPFPDDHRPLLRAARQSGPLMGDQIARAFTTLLAAEAEGHPLCLVLEDLHWGDVPSVRLIHQALRQLTDAPFFVIAFARPEVHERFPRLWAEQCTQEIRLGPLPRRAAERLVRHALGATVSVTRVSEIIERAEGNAFYLEELIRAVAEDRSELLPETVLAMVQTRLTTLDPVTRQVLRAASVFGEVFWAEAVAMLLGRADDTTLTLERVRALVEQEILVPRGGSRLAEQGEYIFRHALLREAAYALLTEEDRVLGHRLAGEWLEKHGERNALVLAAHHELGGEGPRAASFYARAAEEAVWGGDVEAAISHAQRGLACAAASESRAPLLGMLCEIGALQFTPADDILPKVEEVVRLAPRGSMPWVQGMFARSTIAIQAGRIAEMSATLELLRETSPSRDAEGLLAVALGFGACQLDLLGRIREADDLTERLAAIAGSSERDPLASMFWHATAAFRSAYVKNDPWGAIAPAEALRDRALATGHRSMLGVAHMLLGMSRGLLGFSTDAEQLLSAADVPDDEMGFNSSVRPFSLAWVLADREAFDEARACATRLIRSGSERGMPLDEGRGRWVLAEICYRSGDLDSAEREIMTALERLGDCSQLDFPGALATLAEVRLAQSRPREALAAASEARAKLAAIGGCSFLRSLAVLLVYSECLDLNGEHGAAETAVAEAQRHLLGIAAKMGNPADRANFLDRVYERRGSLKIAR
ncbi:uncharacterized protein CMC5_024750 [Chondromyces crocatus]|uniref:non-specific serine/threonine protein kinase n=2 Tax=Chondromyces crocatus TaxID=52 RepID=A0A0K1EBT8_CHOCO|nr:uncharacterized protein CMC5_024750 [Chondromyces crocatus]